ncbi:FtsX-like permease family protein [Spirosoma sp. HMF4905]|uniref:FtsX-like permease family protein n=1 Tax=Spirosoma arboris TaxID=2682092 RepID=A0A7K1SAE2_9BACT|nr:ABC transporter permease [Spirosoma arboris]MVM30777.1 FtsX-like permease family protein [Spirosoma arboris]
MLTNYLKIARRNLWHNKLYTGLNAGGLAVGLTACLLMFLYVKHEFTYDSFHANTDRIVRVTTNLTTPDAPMSVAACPILLASTLKRDYPEVETAARFEPVSATIRYGTELLNEPNVYYSDQETFSVFTYPFVAGNAAQALTEPNTAVVTESFARKHAGRIDIVGKSFLCNKKLYRITGVMADLPSNADMKINALLAKDFTTSTTWLGEDFPTYTFVLFRQTPDLNAFEKKLALLSKRDIQPEFKKMGAEGYAVVFQTELLKDVHFSQGKMADMPKGNKQYGYLFLFLAVFVLAIALLNYINLLTARATGRAKEVGVRKASGALRQQLVVQFLFESFLLSLLSVVLAIALLEVSLPFFNDLLQIQLDISWREGLLMAAIAGTCTTLLGGLYPAFALSGYNTATVLRRQSVSLGRGIGLRQAITVFQFVLAVGMIVGVLVAHNQMNYLQHLDLGFTKEQVLTVHLPDDSLARTSGYALANTLRQRTEIKDASLGSGIQPDAFLATGTTFFQSAGKKREIMGSYLSIDERFLPLMHMKLASGRNVTASEADKNGAFLVNEAFVKQAGWQQAIGQPMEGFMHKGKVVGVVKNFNYRSLHTAVEPLILIFNTFPPANLTLKMKPKHLPLVQASWKQHYPNSPFDYTFMDASFDAQYRKDKLMMTLFNGFALLTILVSCLGLFGLATYSAEQRTKEIGVRKVLGASVMSIVTLLSKDVLKLVLIAIVIASPLAWYAMNQWLADFAYKIDIAWWMFALAGFVAVSIALLTVSFQSVKAALMNPVRSLRSE